MGVAVREEKRSADKKERGVSINGVEKVFCRERRSGSEKTLRPRRIAANLRGRRGNEVKRPKAAIGEMIVAQGKAHWFSGKRKKPAALARLLVTNRFPFQSPEKGSEKGDK